MEKSTPAKPLIEVDTLVKTFVYQGSNGAGRGRMEKTALNGVSLQLMPGETIGIIGSNGSGKSTLLRILAGITRATSGRVSRNGKVGSVLELGSGFHPDLTGRENLLFGAAMLGCKPAAVKGKVEDILAFSEIGEYIDVPVKFYSSGMYMRLAFGLVTALDFDMYLFDEVMAVGDFSFRDKCFARLNELKAAGKGFVLVSHNLGEIAQTCNRVFVMANGQVHFSGEPAAAIQAYGQLQGRRQLRDDGFPQAQNNAAPGGQRPETPSVQIVKAVARAAASGEEQYTFTRSDTVVVEITLDISQVTHPVNVGMNFSDIQDTPLTSGSTHHAGMSITKDGQYVFSWSLPLNIYTKNVYNFNFFVFKESTVRILFTYPKIVSIELDGVKRYVGDTLVQLPIQQDDAAISLSGIS